jgi:hypothetical protein
MARDTDGAIGQMKGLAIRSIFLGLFVFLLSSTCGRIAPEPTEKAGWQCTPLPETFQETDLIGTWQAAYTAAGTTEEVTLRVDGTYQQVYQRSDGYHFETLWQQWWLEYRPSGGIYLHLDGMHYCRLTGEVCAMPDGGGRDRLFHDTCEGRLLEMRNEVVLALVGTKGTRHPSIIGAPRGIALMHMLPASDTTSSFFVLKEE